MKLLCDVIKYSHSSNPSKAIKYRSSRHNVTILIDRYFQMFYVELCLICYATIIMSSSALNGRAYQDGIISRRDMPRAISEYLPATSEGSDDKVTGITGGLRARLGVSVPIGESFNDASLSKIVSYVRSYIWRGAPVFVGGKGWRIWTRRETRDRENAFANPAARGPELFPAAARARLPATIIVATRRETPEETRATARLRRTKSERRINSVFPSRCPGYSTLATDESNTASTAFPFSFMKSEFCPSDRMEAEWNEMHFPSLTAHSPLREKFFRILSHLRDIDNKRRIGVERRYRGKIR